MLKEAFKLFSKWGQSRNGDKKEKKRWILLSSIWTTKSLTSYLRKICYQIEDGRFYTLFLGRRTQITSTPRQMVADLSFFLIFCTNTVSMKVCFAIRRTTIYAFHCFRYQRSFSDTSFTNLKNIDMIFEYFLKVWFGLFCLGIIFYRNM